MHVYVYMHMHMHLHVCRFSLSRAHISQLCYMYRYNVLYVLKRLLF